MTRSRLAAVLLWLATVLTSSVAIAAHVMVEVVAKGVVTESRDDTNAMGYGASGNAVGAGVTITFHYLAASVPTDIYGGARFPAEADYLTYGTYNEPYYGRYMPSWIESTIRFDNRTEFSSLDYDGTGPIIDQVKIQSRAGGATADHFSVYDQIEDDAPLSRGYAVGASVDEYVSKLVKGLSADQRVHWRAEGDGSEATWGHFIIYDRNTSVDAAATISLNSFQVRSRRPVARGGGIGRTYRNKRSRVSAGVRDGSGAL